MKTYPLYYYHPSLHLNNFHNLRHVTIISLITSLIHQYKSQCIQLPITEARWIYGSFTQDPFGIDVLRHILLRAYLRLSNFTVAIFHGNRLICRRVEETAGWEWRTTNFATEKV